MTEKAERRLTVLRSAQDPSVNFVSPHGDGFLEARYVRRAPAYLSCYLSSQSGCNRGCTFCHLTSSRQVSFDHATADAYMAQAERVLSYYTASRPPAQYVNFNFMARGEALANPHFTEGQGANQLLVRMGTLAAFHKLRARFNVSTILPRTLSRPLEDIFSYMLPTIYYSAYSHDEAVRARLMPGALPFLEALQVLRRYQAHSKKVVKIHHALIAGVNDTREAVDGLLDAVADEGLRVEINLVSYNPSGPGMGEPSTPEQVQMVAAMMKDHLPLNAVKVVARVGFDVKASCGMFVGG